MQPPWEGFAWNTKIIHLPASSVSCNHKVACEEDLTESKILLKHFRATDNIQLKLFTSFKYV